MDRAVLLAISRSCGADLDVIDAPFELLSIIK